MLYQVMVIAKDGKQFFFGPYATLEEAQQARDEAEKCKNYEVVTIAIGKTRPIRMPVHEED